MKTTTLKMLLILAVGFSYKSKAGIFVTVEDTNLIEFRLSPVAPVIFFPLPIVPPVVVWRPQQPVIYRQDVPPPPCHYQSYTHRVQQQMRWRSRRRW